MNKFGARKVEIDGERFDSAAEARRWQVLRALEAAGKIADLERQPKFRCVVNGRPICVYAADFKYRQGGAVITEDVKGVRTPVYRLKKKLVEALHGVSIVEIPAR